MASTPIGPFKRQQVVHPPFHHNPTVVQDPTSKELLMFLIGHTFARNGSLGWTPYEAPVFMSTAKTAAGPWTEPQVAISSGPNGTWDSDTTNPTAAFMANGTLAVLYRGEPRWGPVPGYGTQEETGLATATDWRRLPYKRAHNGQPLDVSAQLRNHSLEVATTVAIGCP